MYKNHTNTNTNNNNNNNNFKTAEQIKILGLVGIFVRTDRKRSHRVMVPLFFETGKVLDLFSFISSSSLSDMIKYSEIM